MKTVKIIRPTRRNFRIEKTLRGLLEWSGRVVGGRIQGLVGGRMGGWEMISRYQVLAAIALLTTILFYRTMAQVDGYTPGVDYPIYNSVPFGLTFTCGGKLPGYYADPEARCQVWHWCLPNGRQFSFLCPNGTVFSQTARVCDWWFKVDCNDSPRLYGINDDLYRDINGNRI
ncbi:hypothetical protein HZH68_010226 [Vespula germanica]|uniref:Chitin-binding type-2 domain-containing protein n=1 Tax=Vespula germanica TaxID=30212 RepID=A0A834N1Y3_VESGE|nr:hypothetical protein HZH68_010226 [Vespula germanica]